MKLTAAQRSLLLSCDPCWETAFLPREARTARALERRGLVMLSPLVQPRHMTLTGEGAGVMAQMAYEARKEGKL